MLFGSGIDKLACLLSAAESCGIIERKGSWYSKGDLKLGQGQKGTIDYLKANDKIRESIDKEVRTIIAEHQVSGTSATVGSFAEEEGTEVY